MKKLLVTLNINNYDKDITNLTFPYMRQYAQNIGADFHIINERKFPNFPLMIEEFQMYDYSSEYDWIIFLDADCLINPKARINSLENFRSLIGKFSTALIVDAPYKASIGTSISPIESFSILTLLDIVLPSN